MNGARAPGTSPAKYPDMQLVGLPRANISSPHRRHPPPRPASTALADRGGSREVATLDPYTQLTGAAVSDYLRGSGLVLVIVASSAALWLAIARSIGACMGR